MSDYCTYPACSGRTIPGCHGVCRAAPDGPDAITQLRADLAAANERAEKADKTLAYCEKQWSDTDRVTQSKMLDERKRANAAEADAAALRAQVQDVRRAALQEAYDLVRHGGRHGFIYADPIKTLIARADLAPSAPDEGAKADWRTRGTKTEDGYNG